TCSLHLRSSVWNCRARGNQDCTALTMRFSFKALFLGWWLAGQWVLAGTQPYRKPLIWVSPSEVVALGGNITIRCRSEGRQQMEFYLQKADASYSDTLSTQLAEREEVAFPIVNTKQNDGGIYWCTYCPKLACEEQWSEPSDRVCINITDPSLPRPSIKVNPRGQNAPGMNVTIECQGPEHSLSFALHKSKNQTASQTVGPGSITAKFLFPIVRLEDAGNYTCRYRLKGSPFVWSEPSDPAELILRGKAPSLAFPPISQCHQIENGRSTEAISKCSQKKQDSTASWLTTSAANTTEFLFSSVRLEDAGRYTCRYHRRGNPFVWSEPSDTVELVVRADPAEIQSSINPFEEMLQRNKSPMACGWCMAQHGGTAGEQNLPKPSISVSPSHVVAVGGNVSIHCQSEHNSEAVFRLSKKDQHDPCESEPVEQHEVIFPIINAKAKDAGIYWCIYHPTTGQGSWSAYSDGINITVTDPSLAKPSINLQGEPALGMNVTIECQGPEDGLIFFLRKSRHRTAIRMVEPIGSTTSFSFHFLKVEDAGNYTCQYHCKENPFIWSGPSESVELVVMDHTSPVTNIRLAAAAFVLLALVLIVAETVYSWKRAQLKEPRLS
ncbi:hypothetical protein lerEdw1_006989, partial [Lerista edwardsae]